MNLQALMQLIQQMSQQRGGYGGGQSWQAPGGGYGGGRGWENDPRAGSPSPFSGGSPGTNIQSLIDNSGSYQAMPQDQAQQAQAQQQLKVDHPWLQAPPQTSQGAPMDMMRAMQGTQTGPIFIPGQGGQQQGGGYGGGWGDIVGRHMMQRQAQMQPQQGGGQMRQRPMPQYGQPEGVPGGARPQQFPRFY